MDLTKLNSATKYPSIETYHDLDPKTGGLLESGNPFSGNELVYVTEKVDGVNARIICVDDDWFIGSREDLLTAKDDRVPNVAHGIVEALRDKAEYGVDEDDDDIRVYYVEIYGLKQMPAWKTYGNGTTAGVRLFDEARISREVLEWDVDRIASWRERGGQLYVPAQLLGLSAGHLNVELVPTIARVGTHQVPAEIEEMEKWMKTLLPLTQVALDGSATPKLPEGLVLRTGDRRIIRKARFQSYERTRQLKAGAR